MKNLEFSTTDTSSFYSYAINNALPTNDWWNLSDEEKTSKISLMWFIYLDRIEAAYFDTESIMSVFEDLFHSIREKNNILQHEFPVLFDQVNDLNQLNFKLLELIEMNGENDFKERMQLSQSMFSRLGEMYHILKNAGIGLSEITYQVGSLLQEMEFMAKRVEWLALRHFYSTFVAGNYQNISSLCHGVSFIQVVSSCILYQIEKENRVLAKGAYSMAYDREYNIKMLCSLQESFDFRTFDDDTNLLTPEIADLLFFE